MLGGVATSWPLVGRAQLPATPTIGIMVGGSERALRTAIVGFRDGLKETGYVEGQNVVIEHRFAEGQFDRLPMFASDLVHRQVAVIFVSTSAAALAAQRATATIPIVFSLGEDPLKLGLVASLNRPGDRMTGSYQFTAGLEAKRLGLLHEMVPKATIIAVLVQPNYSAAEAQLRDVREAAAGLGVQIVVLRANAENDFNAAFASLDEQRAEALLVCGSPFFNSRREQLVVLAARHAVPAIYEWRDFAAAGGLMSYGTNLADSYRQGGVYVGRILKGAKPAELPVVQVARFEFVINLTTAKTLGLEVPGALSARADEVIE
jgi:putative ABC transport system substrate-binding protein